MFAAFAPHQISRKQFRGYKSHFVDAVSRFDVIILQTGGTRCQECVFVLCVCAFFFSRVSDDSLPICSAAFLLRIVLSRGVEQDFFQTPHLFSEDTKTERAIAESKCLKYHSFVGEGRADSCMWLLFGHRAGCERNSLVLVVDVLAV